MLLNKLEGLHLQKDPSAALYSAVQKASMWRVYVQASRLFRTLTNTVASRLTNGIHTTEAWGLVWGHTKDTREPRLHCAMKGRGVFK
jgi:hypothetical protein